MRDRDFYLKNLNSLETKLYLFGLKMGVIRIKLNEEEMADYLKWEEERNSNNQLAKITLGKNITKSPNEKRYVMYLFRKKSVEDMLSKYKKD